MGRLKPERKTRLETIGFSWDYKSAEVMRDALCGSGEKTKSTAKTLSPGKVFKKKKRDASGSSSGQGGWAGGGGGGDARGASFGSEQSKELRLLLEDNVFGGGDSRSRATQVLARTEIGGWTAAAAAAASVARKGGVGGKGGAMSLKMTRMRKLQQQRVNLRRVVGAKSVSGAVGRGAAGGGIYV